MRSDQKIEVGQVWTRKRDGRKVEVTRIVDRSASHWMDNDIHWRGVGKPGKSAIFESDFRKRYDLEEPADD